MTRSWFAAGAALALSAPLLPAQEVLKPFRATEDPPVMRAIPVEPPQPIPADPSADTPTATPIPVPRGTPLPRRGKNPPRTEPAATPSLRPGSAPGQTAAAPPEPLDPGEIRIAPSTGARTPEQAQLQVADSYYGRKMYEIAAPEYQRFLDQYPIADDTPAALFRMAECYRHTGSLNAAKAAYDSLISRFPASEFTGPGAYRLAEIFYQEKNFASALPYYRKAAERLKEPQVVNAAKFYSARCMEAAGGSLGSKLEARSVYRDLAESDRATNPFADASRLSYALLLREGDQIFEALKSIQLLAKVTENPDLKAEATVRAGLWELDLEQSQSGHLGEAPKKPGEGLKRAEEDFKKALEMPSLGKWKPIAEIGLLRMSYDASKYQEVLDYDKQIEGDITGDQLPEVLLLCANSQRQLSHFAEALPIYDRIFKDYPGTPYAAEAAYQRLICLYNAEDPKLVGDIDAYLGNSPDAQKRDLVMLMKAESLYKKDDFAGAAPVYAAIVGSARLASVLKGEALFKLGWCYMQTRNFDAANKTYTGYIEENPTSKQLCFAHVQRGMALLNLKNFTGAEKDFVEVIKKNPGCPERELALEQEAGIRGQANDNAGMSEYFQQLLKEFPKSAAAPQANYWIGRTAFESKDYKKAAEHLTQARALDNEHFFERCTLSLILVYYYLEDRAHVASEIDLYRADGKQKVPAEVLRWLCEQYFDSKDYPNSEKYLLMLAERDDVAPRDLLKLGQSQLHLQKYAEAAAVLQKYLDAVHEPATRALGLLELGHAQIGTNDQDGARKSANEALTLQPEGKLSGEARILSGDIEYSLKNWEAAAKVYESVSVILDDDEVTPRALEKAADAYQKASRDADAKRVLNTLQSRYPEYLQQHKKN